MQTGEGREGEDSAGVKERGEGRGGKGREGKGREGKGRGGEGKKGEKEIERVKRRKRMILYCALIVCCTLCNTKRVACSPKKRKGGIMHS